MSLVTHGARSAALALMLCLAYAPSASALEAFNFGCTIPTNGYCVGGARHTYDNQRAVAPGNYYIASWFVNPSTGTSINVRYGWTVAGGEYRTNTDLWLDPYMGNYSGVTLTLNGRFEY